MRFNTTVTNISPLLLFLPTTSWREEPIASDLQSWTNTTTYHTCNATLAKPSVSFSWNGTAIWIYGDRQPQSSPFRVTLDGETQLQNATGNQEGLIFSAVNLVPATHQIIVTNIGDQDDLSPPTLNFNYLIVESKSYDDNTTNVMIPGSDDQFQYYPEVSGSWNNGSENAR
ncbi:hypothetical protein BDQ17DRAFT_381092 [Cyathus striatus]|nr:hypothetical protein BDQ17DRAFT_381092 [Cyathus striatus]